MSIIAAFIENTETLQGFIKPEKFNFVNSLLKLRGGSAMSSRIPETKHLDIFDSTIFSPIPTITVNTTSLTFAECCDVRANEMLEQSKTQQVVVSWSGGIDSTVVLASILKNGYNKAIHNIVVYTTIDGGLKEYPSFFYNFVLPNFKVTTENQGQLIKAGLVYTGEPGDQIFGSFSTLDIIKRYGSAAKDADYRQTRIYLNEMYGDAGGNFFDYYNEITPYCPFTISTVEDWWWWWNFTQKWNYANYKSLLWMPQDSLPYHANLCNFFDTTEFQVWSIMNHGLKLPEGDVTKYKWPAKEYVVEYTKDETFGSKEKYKSVSHRSTDLPNITAIDSNFASTDYKDHISAEFKLV